jgi:hypothetical protein
VDGTPDDVTLWVWSESLNDWVLPGSVDPLLLDATAGAAFFFDPGKYNLIYNGSFEITDGTGSAAATAVPAGWTTLGTTPDFAYNASPTAQGDGLALEVTANGSTNQGIQRTLGGLKASTTYYVTARAAPQVGGDSCSLRTTGGGTNVPGSGINTIASDTDWVTISGYFITDATPTDVVLIAEADADGDICEFDHISVFETSADRRGLTQPGIQVLRDDTVGAAATTLADGATWTAITGLSDLTVEIPGPGYIVKVTGGAALDTESVGGNLACDLRIQETVSAATKRFGEAAMSSGGTRMNIVLDWIEINPAPGTILTYSLDVQDGGGGGERCEVTTTNGGAYLQVEMIPTR